MIEEKYYRGDIVWADNYTAIDNIQCGRRPYLIISNNKCNETSNILTAIPLTSQPKRYMPTHYYIMLNGIKNTVLVEQITCISQSNVVEYIDTIDDYDLSKIEEKIKIQLGLKEI